LLEELIKCQSTEKVRDVLRLPVASQDKRESVDGIKCRGVWYLENPLGRIADQQIVNMHLGEAAVLNLRGRLGGVLGSVPSVSASNMIIANLHAVALSAW
jgi:hypothetical protein